MREELISDEQLPKLPVHKYSNTMNVTLLNFRVRDEIGWNQGTMTVHQCKTKKLRFLNVSKFAVDLKDQKWKTTDSCV